MATPIISPADQGVNASVHIVDAPTDAPRGAGNSRAISPSLIGTTDRETVRRVSPLPSTGKAASSTGRRRNSNTVGWPAESRCR